MSLPEFFTLESGGDHPYHSIKGQGEERYVGVADDHHVKANHGVYIRTHQGEAGGDWVKLTREQALALAMRLIEQARLLDVRDGGLT